MDYIVADSEGTEQGYLVASRKIDIDIGDTNDFELTLDADDYKRRGYGFGYRFYQEGTEYGGIFEDIKVVTKNNSVVIRGFTWRGLLSQKIILPPSSLAYLTVSGDANAVIAEVLGDAFGDLYAVESQPAGISISYQFDRFTDMLTGLTKMLSRASARLNIYFSGGQVHLEALPVTDWSEQLEYGTDNRVSFTIRDYRQGINHLICLGSGQLTDRQILHLYLQGDGTIGSTQHYAGLQERMAVYDYNGAEDLDSLREGGLDRFAELLNYQEMSIAIQDIPVELGDIVGGRERITGMVIKKPVTNKVIKVTGNKVEISYKVGD